MAAKKVKARTRKYLWAALFALIGIVIFMVAVATQTRLFSFAKAPSQTINCNATCSQVWRSDPIRTLQETVDGFNSCVNDCKNRNRIVLPIETCKERMWWGNKCVNGACPDGYKPIAIGICWPVCFANERRNSANGSCVPIPPTPTPMPTFRPIATPTSRLAPRITPRPNLRRR